MSKIVVIVNLLCALVIPLFCEGHRLGAYIAVGNAFAVGFESYRWIVRSRR